jgi:hypothetical protein
MGSSAWTPVDESASAWKPVQETAKPTPSNLPSDDWLKNHYGRADDTSPDQAKQRYKNRGLLDKALDFIQKPVDYSTEHGVNAINAAQAGQYAKSANETVKAAAPIGAAMLPEAVSAAPVATAIGIGTGVVGGKVAQLGAKAVGATPDQQELAQNVGGLAAGLGTGFALKGKPSILPSTERAGAALQDIKASAGDVPIDMTKPGNTALAIMDQADRGATMPDTVRKFITRATKPDSEPLTYAEAKDFQSNISRLSANENMAMNPNMKRLVGQLNQDLKGSLESAADTQGKGQAFVDAMKEYHNAMTLKDWTADIKAKAIKTAIAGAGLYTAKELLGIKLPGE